MHYYQFNIGDYRRDTQHLSLLEHGIYRLLLDQYYLTEKPINANALRLICVRTTEDMQIAMRLLSEFFYEVEPGQFVHQGCDKIINKFKEKSLKASTSAKIRWDANAWQAQCDGNANHKPLTTNQEPENHLLSSSQAKPDPVRRLNGKKPMIAEVASYLNLQAQRNFRIENPNGTPTAGALVIEQRLKEGYTVAQCKDVIGVKSNEWMGDEKMHQFLNPETLFRKKNFTKYLAEAEAQQ